MEPMTHNAHSYLNARFAIVVCDIERKVSNVLLHGLLIESSTNESLHIEHSVLGIQSRLILCSVTNESAFLVECHVGGCGSVTLIIGDDLNSANLVHSHTRVGGAEIDANCGRLVHILALLEVGILSWWWQQK